MVGCSCDWIRLTLACQRSASRVRGVIRIFTASDSDKQRYGDDEFGLGCILARNLLKQNAGTRMVYVYDGDRSGRVGRNRTIAGLEGEEAAELLGVSRQTMYDLIRKYDFKT